LWERLTSEKWGALEELVSGKAPETLWLDFKAKSSRGAPGHLHDDDRKNLAKTVSAFANTEGGILIFGIRTTSGPTRDEADRADAFEPVDSVWTFHRSVEAVLRDVTNPAVPGLDLLAVEDPSRPNYGVIALFVPPSIGGPHRANMGPGDVREHYYQRSGSRSDIMPHSVLAALMGRVPTSRLSLALTLWNDPEAGLRFLLELRNTGRGSARQPAIRLFEIDRRESNLWHTALSSTQLALDWVRSRNSPWREDPSEFLQSAHDTIVYPGDRLVLTSNGPGTIPGNWRWGTSVDFPAKGAIYAAEAAPVEFAVDIRIRSAVSEPVVFELPDPSKPS
jgi:hypothetical protein